MPPNKRLPILKLFLFPVLAGIGYGAYCYYSEQYLQKIHKVHAPIRYMQQLYNILQQTQSTVQLQKLYGLMRKHMDIFVIDPSEKEERLLDNTLGREMGEVGEATGISRLKVSKDFEINYFNLRKEKKNGKFALGLWIDLHQITLYSLKLAEPMINLAQKSLRIRQKKCESIAELSSKNLQKGYLEQYIECIGGTESHAAKMQRQVDIARKMSKFQLFLQ